MDQSTQATLIATFIVTIAYITLCNIAAAFLTWRIFSHLGWGPASRALAIGFGASAVAWAAFSGGNEVLVELSPAARGMIVMVGLVIKAVGMTAIVIGFHLLYRATSVLFIRKAPSTGRAAVMINPDAAEEMGIKVEDLEIGNNANWSEQQPEAEPGPNRPGLTGS